MYYYPDNECVKDALKHLPEELSFWKNEIENNELDKIISQINNVHHDVDLRLGYLIQLFTGMLFRIVEHEKDGEIIDYILELIDFMPLNESLNKFLAARWVESKPHVLLSVCSIYLAIINIMTWNH
jgi:hypothetical protein